MLKFKDRALLSLSAFILFTLSTGLFFSLFISERTLFPVSLIIAFAVIFSCGAVNEKRTRLVPVVWLGITAIFLITFIKNISDGTAALLNGITETFKRVHPRNYDIFTVSDGKNIFFAAAVLSSLCALLCVGTLRKYRRLFGAAGIVVVIVTTAVFMPIFTPAQYALAVSVIIFLTTLIFTAHGSTGGESTHLRLWFRTAAVLLSFSFALNIIFGDKKPTAIESVTEKIVAAIDTARYGDPKKAGLTDGDMSAVGERKNDSETLLRVTMSSPESCYLRGFAGGVYENNKWKMLPDSVLYEYADTFLGLHQKGFFAQTQLTTASFAVDSETADKYNTVKIENIGLPSKYIYAPYGLDTFTAPTDIKEIGDEKLNANGIKGERAYTLTAAPELVLQNKKLTSLIVNNSDNGNVRDYLDIEASYNRFVYDEYTSLPSDIDSYLADKLGGYEKDDGEVHFDYNKAKQNILYYLTENITYDENTSPTESGVDFILNFLDGTKHGYDVHYAAAAVMIFRYYGIPARFAEGYVITNKDAENAKKDEPIDLDITHAHAWAEYYSDGIGWLPFEATPTYLSEITQPETYRDISGLTGTTENDRTNALQPDEPDTTEKPSLMSFLSKNRLTIILIFAVSAVVILLLLFVLWLVRERKKTKIRKKLFLSDDTRLAVITAFNYIADLMSANGIALDGRPASEYADMLDSELREKYLEATAVWQLAEFGKTPPTEEQRKAVLQLKDELWQKLWSGASVPKKILIKFMYFL